MKVVFTSSRSWSIVSPTGCSGGKAATTGSIIRPIVSFGYWLFFCHWRTSSGLAAPSKCASFSAAPSAERLLMSCASSVPNACEPDWSVAAMKPLPLLLLSSKFIEDRGTMLFMTQRAITIRLAEPRDAQAIALMSRDFIEAGLGWKYDAPRVLRAIRDRDTLAVVACEGGKTPRGGAVNGFAIME